MKKLYPSFSYFILLITAMVLVQACTHRQPKFRKPYDPSDPANAHLIINRAPADPFLNGNSSGREDLFFTTRRPPQWGFHQHLLKQNELSYSDKKSEPVVHQEMQKLQEELHPIGYEEEEIELIENKFIPASSEPFSTFGIDVDGASYSNVRRSINAGYTPHPNEIRVEEMINYFPYQYPYPKSEDPLYVISEISECPWNADHRMVSIGIKGKEIDLGNTPASNFVFLVDVSGSMQEPDRLPLVVTSLKLLTANLKPTDKVAIVVYAGAAGLVLPSTIGDHKAEILRALDTLSAGGSTAGSEGIMLAYKIASENFIQGGNNRVILTTDGDFNVGVSSDAGLDSLITKKKEEGIFLSVLGYGTGNYQDAKMQSLADKGNGNHFYIDSEFEAKKVLVNEMGGTLFTIAKDVKLQIEFNPAKVKEYRLIGYENRMLNKEDFEDDKKDAGELGAGHCVTALYEIIPTDGNAMNTGNLTSDVKPDSNLNASTFDDVTLLTINLRYKQPDGNESKLVTNSVRDTKTSLEYTSETFRFAASVAEFALLLRDSEYKGNANFEQVLSLASGAVGVDTEGYRKEFIELVKKAQSLNSPAVNVNK